MIRMLVEVVIIIGGYSDNIMVTADVVITIVIEMISGRGYGNEINDGDDNRSRGDDCHDYYDDGNSNESDDR